MADTISSSYNYKTVLEFEDGDTRTIAIPNPPGNLDKEDVDKLNATLLATKFFIGDRKGSALTGFNTGYTEEQLRTKLDIG